MEIIRKLHRSHSVSYSEIALITPYRAQKEIIREVMDEEGFKEDDRPSIVTIMESQGYSISYSIMVPIANLAEGNIGHFSQ